MAIAKARGQTLDGWDAARDELWRHVDEETVLVGQSLSADMQALRVIHKASEYAGCRDSSPCAKTC